MEMYVAEIRDIESTDHVHVLFFQSPQIFFLAREHPQFDEILKMLQTALENQSAVNVLTTEPHGQMIESIQ